MQSRGERCVTTFVNPSRLESLIENRDAFDFATHDLKHMENFVQKERYLEQVGLSYSLFCCLDQIRAMTVHMDSETRRMIDYVLSDMNADVKHMFCWFKAHLINGHVRAVRGETKQEEEHFSKEEEMTEAAAATSKSNNGDKNSSNKEWLSKEESASFQDLFRKISECLLLSEAATEATIDPNPGRSPALGLDFSHNANPE